MAVARSALLQALVIRYEITADIRWLDLAVEQIDDMLNLRASNLGLFDYRGRSLPAWPYRLSTGDLAYIAEHSGMVGRVIMQFVGLVRRQNVERYLKNAEEYAAATLAALNTSEENYDHEYGAYRWELDLPTREPFSLGRILSTNHNLLLCHTWLLLGNYHKEPAYVERFARYMKLFRDGCIDRKNLNGGPPINVPGIELRQGQFGEYYFWYYDPYLTPPHRMPEDILHFSWDLEVVLHDASYTNCAFGKDDLPRLARTVDRFIVDPDSIPPRLNAKLDTPSADRPGYLAFWRAFARLPYYPGLPSLIPSWRSRSKKVADALIEEMLSQLKLETKVTDAARVNYFNSPPWLLNYIAFKSKAMSADSARQ